MVTSFLHVPTAERMLVVNREIVRRALDAGQIDVGLGAGAVLYIRRLEHELREGIIDGDVAVLDASRVARAISLTRPDARREVRDADVRA
ncbi:hypothetical protein HCU64_00070 [Methylobacterium sp. C25]|uniref:hypothetical protein n=1 Tax=Methylobacterium sp. C25 TaxID=2721622 RepID=UPI001F271DC6|nr:hypothetical protein [Methylobacterium sp. C25]MCE4222134.1 hypothetical protein [Methylobacterium sp. C25]